MQLLVFRHGIAEDSAPGGDDERALTDEGKRRTAEVAAGLAKIADAPQAILSSPKLRAWQSAQLLGAAFNLEPETIDQLGEGDAHTLGQAISIRQESRLMIVGHEPTLSQLIAVLVTGRIPELGGVKLSKAGCAAIELDFNRGPMPRAGTLHWLVPPELMRGLG